MGYLPCTSVVFTFGSANSQVSLTLWFPFSHQDQQQWISMRLHTGPSARGKPHDSISEGKAHNKRPRKLWLQLAGESGHHSSKTRDTQMHFFLNHYLSHHLLFKALWFQIPFSKLPEVAGSGVPVLEDEFFSLLPPLQCPHSWTHITATKPRSRQKNHCHSTAVGRCTCCPSNWNTGEGGKGSGRSILDTSFLGKLSTGFSP